jgi:excisionase family DNA binding protein
MQYFLGKQHGGGLMAGDERAPGWMTIREAADYLSIGEPTLYRWMKEGRITYRKIGDSTRFLKEDLDGFVEVFRGSRDAEKAKTLCPSCRSDRLVEGDARSSGLLYFHPRKTKFWTLKQGLVGVKAFMCRNCGAVSLFGDMKLLEKLMGRGGVDS